MEWIKIKDKLPEKCTEVILFGLRQNFGGCFDDTYGGGLRFVGYISHEGEWRQRVGIYMDFPVENQIEITHWQELPDYAINATTYKDWKKEAIKWKKE